MGIDRQKRSVWEQALVVVAVAAIFAALIGYAIQTAWADDPPQTIEAKLEAVRAELLALGTQQNAALVAINRVQRALETVEDLTATQKRTARDKLLVQKGKLVEQWNALVAAWQVLDAD